MTAFPPLSTFAVTRWRSARKTALIVVPLLVSLALSLPAQAQVTIFGIQNGLFGTLYPGVPVTLSTTSSGAPIARITGPANSTQTLLFGTPSALIVSGQSVPLSSWQARSLTNNQSTVANFSIPLNGLVDVTLGPDGVMDIWIGLTATPTAGQVSGLYTSSLQISLSGTPSTNVYLSLTGTVVQSLATTSVRSLSFGFLPKGTGKTISPASAQSGRLNVSGQEGATVYYTLTVPAALTRISTGETLPVSEWAARATTGNFVETFTPASGTRRTVILQNPNMTGGLMQLDFGGTITVGSLQRAGAYSGTILVTVSYAGF